MIEQIIQAIRESALIAFQVYPERIEPIMGGANNLVFRVTAGDWHILAKAYFQHPGDRRDRLSTEFGMLNFLWENGLRCIPKPLHANCKRHIGLYQFVEGCRLCPEEISWPDVEQLVQFLADLWRLRETPGALTLPHASDSSFSIAGFLTNVSKRLRRAANALPPESMADEVDELINRELPQTLKAIRRFIEHGARDYRLDLDACLPMDQRTLNPADHGFHNALRGHDGRLTFLDFEYAGWDDPAQMICNACLQPAVPIPPSMQRHFVDTILNRFGNPTNLAARCRLLYPLFGFKWSLIMLNEFIPVSRERRYFAGARPEDNDRQRAQLDKSKHQIKAVQDYLSAPFLFAGLDGTRD